jgi:2-dehydro-3-deoxyphosphogluconate aldolase/(4S)-4-hydroxy-2-oxoglutarate aldolase
VVPVAVLQRADDARLLADALSRAGLPLVEVTFRTKAAVEAIRILTAETDLLVGAGTILTVADVERAIDAGAAFCVMPGFSSVVVYI